MPRRLLRVVKASLLVAMLGVTPAAASGAPRRSSVGRLANRCFAIRSGGRFVAPAGAGGGYRVSAGSIAAGAARFYLKPTGLGTYLLYDQRAKLMSVAGNSGAVGRVSDAGPRTEWELGFGAPTIRSALNRRFLSAKTGSGTLMLASAIGPAAFSFAPTAGCTPFPEAQVGATGAPSNATNRDGTVFGFVDAHLHITANMRAGGRVIYGEPFDRFGIAAALGQDAKYHGANGGLDYTGNLLRGATPTGMHDTHGWPTFRGWPVYNTQTHQQTYYVWLQRAWEAGERLVVAQTVDDQALCLLEPHRNDGCNETRSIKAQIRALRELQNYVDAQNGGPGQGWFRLVYSPEQARRVIKRGKLAVIIGI